MHPMSQIEPKLIYMQSIKISNFFGKDAPDPLYQIDLHTHHCQPHAVKHHLTPLLSPVYGAQYRRFQAYMS